MPITRILLFWTSVVLVVCTLAFASRSCRSKDLARKDFGQLLNGADDIRVVAIHVHGHGVTHDLTDPEGTAYLMAMFRSARKLGYLPEGDGVPLRTVCSELDVWLSSGESVLVGINVPLTDDCILLLFPLDEDSDPLYYIVALQRDIPASVSAELDIIRKS